MSHAILSPSAAYRWFACTPSARFEQQIPEKDTNYSEEGDLAHELGAFLLKDSFEPYKDVNYRAMLSKHKSDIDAFYLRDNERSFYPEMLEHCDAYVDYVRGRKYTRYAVEVRLEIRKYIPLSFGRGDFLGYHKGTVYVTDFKYGAGVRVKARENPQLMLYGVGGIAYFEEMGLEVHTVVMSVFQPRMGDPDEYTMSARDLLEWVSAQKPKAELALAGQGEFVSGDHCQFCKAKLSCAEYFNRFATLLNLKDKREIDDDDLRLIAQYGDGLIKYVNDQKDRLKNRILSGERVKGFKVIAGQKNRAFRSEDEVIEIAIAENLDVCTTVVLPLTTIEKNIGVKRFKELFTDVIVTKESGPKLVADSAAGDPVERVSAADFEDDYTNLL